MAVRQKEDVYFIEQQECSHIFFPQEVHCFCPAWCLQFEDMYYRQAVIILKMLYLP